MKRLYGMFAAVT